MIILKSEEEISKIAEAGRIVAECLDVLKKMLKPGVTTQELNDTAEHFIEKQGAHPAFKGYRNYPASLCTSINEEVVHGIPSLKGVKEGDIIGLDLGVIVEGYYGDGAITLPVGCISPLAQRLLSVTEKALCQGISHAWPGKRLSDISSAVQSSVEKEGFSVVTDFVGHGIGRDLHEEPPIPNFGKPGRGPLLQEGMILAIEPMVNAGGPAVRILEDGWTAVTVDGSLSAHFEHTVAVTSRGPCILTQRHNHWEKDGKRRRY